MYALQSLKDTVTELPRGGFLVQTSAGYVQVGAPPETIKDTMLLPESVPQIFVLPVRLFNPEKGISLSELEFPIYFNFFFKKRRTTIVATREQAARLERVLQEAVFGPADLDISVDAPDAGTGLSDIRPEMAHYRSFTFADLFAFAYLENGRCRIGEVEIRLADNGCYAFTDKGRPLAEVPASIEYTPRFDIGARLKEPYRPPLFAVTCLGPSHGFDPTENTSGFILWLNHRGVMVDPPVNSTEWLRDSNVNPKLIDSVILTHCHADHDAGTFQKLMEEVKVTIYTTRTIMESFLRKYSALADEPVDYLRQLFDFFPVAIGKPFFIHGARFIASYSLHSIPTIGFTLRFQNRSFVYSSDHQGEPRVHQELLAKGVLTPERYAELAAFPWDSQVIYHEAGIPPLHTSIGYFTSLPREAQKRIHIYHIAKKDFPSGTALELCKFGMEHTVNLPVAAPPFEKTYEVLGLLRHLDFFHGFSVQKAQEFMAAIEEESFKKGRTIIRRGTKGEKFYIIYSGNVAVSLEGLERKKIYGEFEYFGEVALMTEQPTTADVVAATDVVVYSMTKDKFLNFIANTEFEETLKRLVKNRDPETWNVLSGSRVFSRLTSYQKTWIESALVPLALPGRGVLVEQGRPFDRMFIIREGEIEALKDGRKIATLRRGDFIGELGSIETNAPSPYRFQHDLGVALFALSREDVAAFARANPGLIMKFKFDELLKDR
jgi:CRP-like cAMP-binding protein